MPVATYLIEIDWNNDGSFAGANDDVTADVRAAPGLSMTRGRDGIRQLSPPNAGQLDAELDNQSRDYSYENSSSPLVGDLLPGRPIRVRATYSSTTYNLWRGFLDDLLQHPEPMRLSVGIPSLGPLSKLAGKTVSTALYSSITTDVAIGHILDAVGWPAGDRVLDTGKTTLDWWWLQEQDAFEAARQLLNTEGPGAALYEDGQGRIVFESRHYRITTTRSNTSQATFSDTTTEPILQMPFEYNPGLKDIINVSEMTVKVRSAKATATVWSLGSAVTLGANETRQFRAYSSDPFQSAITPVNATDYTVTAGSISSVSLDRTSGQSVTISLTAGTSGATVTGLQLRADPVTTDNTSVITNTVSAASSITAFGRQVWAGSTRAEIPVNTAQDLVNAIVGRYQDPRPIVVITVSNANATRFVQCLTREISDRITVVEGQTGANAPYWIEHIAHAIRQGGMYHETRFGCEKAQTEWAVWGSAVWGTSLWGY